MKKQNNGGNQSQNKTNHNQQEHIDYRSDDGRVEIITTPGRKFPRHKYKIVVLRFRPQAGTRILQLCDGSGGVEVLLTHREVGAHLKSLNKADPKAEYTWRHVPEKPKARKEFWRRVNESRHRNKFS